MIAILQAFFAGFVSTLVAHQAVRHVFYLIGLAPTPAWSFAPAGPLGVPSVLSLAFWGGVWGIALWYLIRDLKGAKHWLTAFALGAVLPSAIALFVVFPMKGLPFAGGWEAKTIVGALILNGAWGLGVAALMAAMRRRMP